MWKEFHVPPTLWLTPALGAQASILCRQAEVLFVHPFHVRGSLHLLLDNFRWSRFSLSLYLVSWACRLLISAAFRVTRTWFEADATISCRMTLFVRIGRWHCTFHPWEASVAEPCGCFLEQTSRLSPGTGAGLTRQSDHAHCSAALWNSQFRSLAVCSLPPTTDLNFLCEMHNG